MSQAVGDSVATTLKRQAAKQRSYDNTKRTVRKEPPTGSHLGTVQAVPKA